LSNDALDEERERIVREMARRRAVVDGQRYEAWQPAASLARSSRVRDAAVMLKRAGVFPSTGARALEVGVGRRGWLPDLIAFGVREPDLAAIDLDATHVDLAKAALPAADVRVGDASALPFADASFDLVVASTLFTSILSDAMRSSVAREIVRVLRPGGALLWYDFAFDNPMNKNVRGIGRRELKRLFDALHGDVRSTTLAPPLARAIAPLSWTAATVLEALPVLRTHLIAVLVKR
jgi:ubiquinone/menaquinone biosynthesis C-methylase UbiE